LFGDLGLLDEIDVGLVCPGERIGIGGGWLKGGKCDNFLDDVLPALFIAAAVDI
jgi:hypothetical protein